MRWFVTGTDTEVGKSVVTACLAAARRGSVLAAKPLASGVSDGVGEDAALLGFAAGHAPLGFARWTTPVSPHRAALLEGSPLDVPALTAWVTSLSAPTVLVEGVGGWRVPLRLEPRFEVPDLARVVGGPVVIVAADRLGVLNHTRLTVQAVQDAGLEVAGVVLNRGRSAPGDASIASNGDDLRALLDCPIVQLDPVVLTDIDDLARAGRALWEILDATGLRA